MNGRLRGRRGARLAAITSGGAIPETGLYTVVAEPDGMVIGTVDEDFAIESMAGDVMLLGNTSWRIRRVTSAGRVLVEDAHGAAPTIPFWRGEAPARTEELSGFVSEIRQTVSDLTPGVPPGAEGARSPGAQPAVDWLKSSCGLDDAGAEQLVEYVVTGRAVLGAVPTQRTIIAERFFDEGGGMQLVIHAPFGARINKAWGLALRKRFCRSFNFELQASATDDGINIALAEQHSFPLIDVFGFLRPPTVREVLEQASLASPIFGTRWRWDACRALALLRFRGGKKLPIQILRLQSDDLLAAVFPDVAACQENIEGDISIPDHPLVREVMKDVLTEAMDLDGLVEVLEAVGNGSVRCVAVDTPVPSVFSHEILNANPYAFLDDAPLEERRARAVELRRVLPDSVLREVGGLDQDAVRDVRRHAWPDVRDADDLHDALLTLVVVPEQVPERLTTPLADRLRESVPAWEPFFAELEHTRRAGRAVCSNRAYWVATERAKAVLEAVPDVTFERALPELQHIPAPDTDVRVSMVQGWMSHSGPVTAVELSDVLGIDADHVNEALLRLEASGWALRGTFTGAADLEWCERRLLARIHRLTLGALRREIAPVTAAEFMRWLLDWQHLSAGSRLSGEHGTLEALRQLQGFEAPASSWERHLLPDRVRDYDPSQLDRLSLTGVVGWGRLSPHPAMIEAPTDDARRVVPTSAAPITFFVREDADWMVPPATRDRTPAGLSHNARDVLAYLERAGASFFSDIVRGAKHLNAEVETALWELVTAGLVTADGFDSLRALIDPHRRAGHGSGRSARPRHGTGRWALLSPHSALDRTRVVDSACRMLLGRYGVVFRELVSREANVPAWRELLIAFRRMEDRGDVRGGRFVSGFVGEQFAVPIAVESLRALRHRAPSLGDVTVSAADPLNLVGIVVPGERVPAVTGRIAALVLG